MNEKGHKKSSNLWGIFFIALAAYIILEQFNLITFTFGVGRIILCGFFLASLLDGIAHRSIWGTIIPSAFLICLIGNPIFDLDISLWTLGTAAVLLCIGLSIIFPHKHRIPSHIKIDHEEWQGGDHIDAEQSNNGHYVCKNQFGASTKYINTGDFKGACITNSFGELKVYFDTATIITSPVTIEVHNSFGELQLFLPKEWAVNPNIRVTIGDCKENNKNMGNNEPVVYLIGDVSLGEIQITYV